MSARGKNEFKAEKCIELGVDHIGSLILSQDDWRLPLIKDVMRLSEGTGTRDSLISLFKEWDMLIVQFRGKSHYAP